VSWSIFLTFALAPIAFAGARELRKMSRTGVMDDGGDWDIRLDDEPVLFGLHFVLAIAPIFGFVTALALSLMELFG
jgi:hypothetical protein